MAKRNGNLRVLKGRAIYGPMSREEVLDLLADGRISGTDRVSVRAGPWIPLLDYLESSAEEAESAEATSTEKQTAPPPVAPPPVARANESHPTLRVLHANGIHPPMTRAQVVKLLDEKQLSGDELVCASNGTWTRLAEFMADRPAAPAPQTPSANAFDDILNVLGLNDSPKAEREDEWFVRVRGVRSAILPARHVKMLIDVREVTADTPARHAAEGETSWKPLKDVPQLAVLLPNGSATS
jgi:hypothetical protein